jgi:hypothetical protein
VVDVTSLSELLGARQRIRRRPDNPVAHELFNARRKAGAYSYQ